MNTCSVCHGKPPRNILLTLNGIVENWLPWRMSQQRCVKIVVKNIFLPKPLINSKLPSNDIAHIKLFKCRYFNFVTVRHLVKVHSRKGYMVVWHYTKQHPQS